METRMEHEDLPRSTGPAAHFLMLARS